MESISQAITYLENNETNKALTLLKQQLTNASAENKLLIADVYLEWGFLEEAKDVLEDLLMEFPNETELKILLADIYIEWEDDKAAIAILSDIKEDDPFYLQALLQQADLYQAEGLFEVAEQKLITAKRMAPKEPVIAFALAEFLFSMGEYQRAISYYEELYPETTEFANVSIVDRLAEASAAIGKYEEALELFGQVEDENPDFLFKYGLTAFQAHRNDIAIHVWEKLIKSDEHYHSVYQKLAKAYQAEGMLKEAFETCKQGLAKDEFNKQLYYDAGYLAYQLNDLEKGISFMRQAIVLDPDYKEAVLFLIDLFKENDEFHNIIDLIHDIKENGAFDPLYEWALANAYNEEEEYEEALKHYKEAYSSFKSDSEFLKEYGYFLVEEGNRKEAISLLTSYLELEPTDTEVEEYVLRLKDTSEE